MRSFEQERIHFLPEIIHKIEVRFQGTFRRKRFRWSKAEEYFLETMIFDVSVALVACRLRCLTGLNSNLE